MRAIVICLALAACAHGGWRCETHGGPAWSEYRSKHFLVDTDATQASAAVLVERLETMHLLGLRALVGNDVEIPGRLRVVAFASDAVFADLADPGVGGYYTRGRFGEPTVVIPISAMRRDPETLAHELAHHLSYYIFPDQPRWLSEGLATFIQTVATVPEREAITGSHVLHYSPEAAAGQIPEFARNWSIMVSPIPAARLLTWGGAEDRDVPGLYHASSWLLYHWLWNERGAKLSDFQKRLEEGDTPAAAWRAAFPEFDPGRSEDMRALDRELERYRRAARFVAYRVKAPVDAGFEERPFPSSEVHLLLASVRQRWPRAKEEREAMLRWHTAEALGEDPANPVAAMGMMNLQSNATREGIRNAVQRAPGDWRGWLLLGAVAEGAERESALRKAVQLEPDNAMAQNELAWLLARSGRAAEALPFANRALDLAPWNPNLIDTLAEVAARLGKCAEALRLESRAVAMQPKNNAFGKRQAEVQQRCAPK